MTFKIPEGSPVFKAMDTNDIESMRQRFCSFLAAAAGDDFYSKNLEKKRKNEDIEDVDIKNIEVIDKINASTYQGFNDANPEAPVLGSARLKRTFTPQPLHTNLDVDINYSLPFEQSDSSITIAWPVLIELEELLKQPSPNTMKVNTSFRFCLHQIQMDISSAFDQNGKPEDHMKFADFMNNMEGQNFLLRFLKILKPNYLKRFFFTAFIVFQHVTMDDSSEFAMEFMTRLSKFLKTTKPKWVIAFLREITHCGFKNLIQNRFKLGCAALVISAARHMRAQLQAKNAQAPSEEGTTNETMLYNSISAFVANIEKENVPLIPADYDTVFMGVILRAVLSVITPESKIFTTLTQC